MYRQSRNTDQNLIKAKKKIFIENKLTQNIAKPKELWKTLKDIGLPTKGSKSTKICLQKDGEILFDECSTADIFKTFFSNLANKLLDKLPNPSNRFGISSISDFYKDKTLTNKLTFIAISKESILDILNNLDTNKTAGIDNLSGRFLKDGAKHLALPIAQLCNLSINTASFPNCCKIAKLTPLYKKGNKTEPKNYRPISLLPLISKIP